MTEKNNKTISFECNCGCTNVKISKLYWEVDDEGSLDYCMTFWCIAFYTLQRNVWRMFKDRIKLIWFILTKGEHRLHEILLPPKEFKELKDMINSFYEEESETKQ